jgi:hypothetical protein
VVAAARANLGNNEPKLENGPFQIEPEHLKVRKSIWDWFAFRSLTAVRRRIFGKPDTLDRAVPAMVKDKRLGQEGRQALEEGIISELSRRFPSEAVRVSDAMLTTHSESLGKDLTDKLNAAKDKYAALKADLTQRIQDNLAIREKLDDLSRQAQGVLAEVDMLGRKYQSYSRVTGAVTVADTHDGIAPVLASASVSSIPTPDDGGFCECGHESPPSVSIA